MRFKCLLLFLFLAGCDVFPDLGNNGQLLFPPQPPVFEFSYVNSQSFVGWIRFQNQCKSIVSYKWHFGFRDENGNEAVSFSSAPKVKYPSNGTYRVLVEGVDTMDKKHEKILSVMVTNN